MNNDVNTHNKERLTLSPLEAARFSGVGLNTLREAVRSGNLPSIRIGRNYRIRRAALECWLVELEGAS